jgi:hypothetical protein
VEHIPLPIGMLPFTAHYDLNLKCLAFPRNFFEPWCAVDALKIETVLRKFKPWEQNLERVMNLLRNGLLMRKT